MNIHELAQAQVNRQREEVKEEYDCIWTLGKLINALQKFDKEEELEIAWEYYMPTGVDSYRGYYNELAISYGDRSFNDDDMTVGKFIGILESANGGTFTGWKGGEYTMNLNT